jgi:hypothetical protein
VWCGSSYFQFQLDKIKLLESTDTTAEDFQAIYTSMYELIMEPLKKKQQAAADAEEEQKLANAVAEDAHIDEGPPAKRRKIAKNDDDDNDFGMEKKQQAPPPKAKASKSSAPEIVLPRSTINEALNQDKLSTLLFFVLRFLRVAHRMLCDRFGRRRHRFRR